MGSSVKSRGGMAKINWRKMGVGRRTRTRGDLDALDATRTAVWRVWQDLPDGRRAEGLLGAVLTDVDRFVGFEPTTEVGARMTAVYRDKRQKKFGFGKYGGVAARIVDIGGDEWNESRWERRAAVGVVLCTMLRNMAPDGLCTLEFPDDYLAEASGWANAAGAILRLPEEEYGVASFEAPVADVDRALRKLAPGISAPRLKSWEFTRLAYGPVLPSIDPTASH